MENEIEFLKKKYPQSEVFKSLDKDFICVRHTLGSSGFMNDKGEKFLVPITNTEKYHIDTIKLEILLKS